VAIVLEDGRFAGDFLLRPVDADFVELADAEIVTVDIPIGFGPREAERAARAFLTGTASVVFPAPPRDVLEGRSARDYASPLRRMRSARGSFTSRTSLGATLGSVRCIPKSRCAP
jgi:predicted RNase H-like nuclease